MPFNTPNNTPYDRSSVTPPEREGSHKPRSTFRMKTESARSKDRRRRAHPDPPLFAVHLAEEQKRHTSDANGPQDRPVWMDLDSDDAGAGPLDKDDALYSGRSVRSRIASVQDARDQGIKTRSSKRSVPAELDPPPNAQPSRSPNDSRDRERDVERGRSSGTSRTPGSTKRVYKSAAFVDSGEDDAPPVLNGKRPRTGEPSSEGPSASSKKHRSQRPEREWPMVRTPSPAPARPSPHPSPPAPPPLGSDTDLPSVLEVMNAGQSRKQPSESRIRWVDDEAEESEQDVEVAGADRRPSGRTAPSDDEYDLDDPFINDDDGSESSNSSAPSDHPGPGGRKSSLSSPFKPTSHRSGDWSEESGDSDGEDGHRPMRRLTKGPRAPVKTSHVPDEAAAPPKALAGPRPQRTNPYSVENTVGGENAKRNRQSVDAAPKGKGKGKGKVRMTREVSDGSEVEDLGGNLGDLSEWERTQIELAIFNSKRMAEHGSQGETSSSRSAMSTPRATTMFTTSSPPLSTPQATVMFTSNATPPVGVTLPTSASASSVGVPMTMADMVRMSRAIAAGDTTTTPSSFVPGPSSVATPPVPPVPATERIQLIIRCRPGDIPAVCECKHPSFQDVLLAPAYESVENRRAGHLEPWGHTPGSGFVMFSAWAEQCPRMNAHIALDAVNFSKSGHFHNPSRSSPTGAGLYEVPGQKDRYNFYCAGDDPVPMVGVVTGMMEDSQLTEPSSTGLRQRWARVILHNQEFHLYKGYVRMVTGHDFLYAQYNKHALQFSTRPMLKSPNNPNNKNKDQSKKDRAKGLRVPASKMFSNTAASAPGNRLAADSFSLPAEATVPVYDARAVPSFDFNANLSRLADALPAWTEGEVPYGSFVVVGHTLTLYRALSGNWTLGLNLQWVIVVGTPEDDD